RKEGIEEEIIYDFVMWAIIAGLLGARIWEVAFSWQNYTSDPCNYPNGHHQPPGPHLKASKVKQNRMHLLSPPIKNRYYYNEL
ncbi:MAG: hypothetical protein M1609_04745, partial [Firmicutes bacterium]|nr:hypothetical protein [Bacillota bacterium]